MMLCKRCNKREVEDFGDDEPSIQCGYCNDRDIEHSKERAEWKYYHPNIKNDEEKS